MINPDLELQQLRRLLQATHNIESWQVNDICDNISNSIDDGTQQIISAAYQQAVEYAQSIGADRFIEEIRVVDVGNSFKITTISGILDFSQDEIHNLPNLLKGRESRVIPITDTKTVRSTNLIDLMQITSKSIQRKRNTSISVSASPSCFALAKNMVTQLNARRLAVHTQKQQIGPTRFRTASIKQDPNKSWVIPAKDLDMTDFINDLNSELERQIDALIRNEIDTVMEML